jgi:transcriptional regulator with XRE-family HTH domain
MGGIMVNVVSGLTTGQRIRLRRETRGMSRPVLAGLIGRSADWLKKIERGERQLNSLALLLQVADVLGVRDLSELTGDAAPVPAAAWNKALHPVVPEIRRAMHEPMFAAGISATTSVSPGSYSSASGMRGSFGIYRHIKGQRSGFFCRI